MDIVPITDIPTNGSGVSLLVVVLGIALHADVTNVIITISGIITDAIIATGITTDATLKKDFADHYAEGVGKESITLTKSALMKSKRFFYFFFF